MAASFRTPCSFMLLTELPANSFVRSISRFVCCVRVCMLSSITDAIPLAHIYHSTLNFMGVTFEVVNVESKRRVVEIMMFGRVLKLMWMYTKCYTWPRTWCVNKWKFQLRRNWKHMKFKRLLASFQFRVFSLPHNYKLQIKICNTTVLPTGLYVRELCCPALRKNRLKVFGNKVNICT
jgi:hypothetical protein